MVRSPACWTWLALTLMGCSASNPLGLSSDGQLLVKEANLARKIAPGPAPLPRELAKARACDYVVEQGDVLLIQPADFDSSLRFPGDQPVLPDGHIHLGRFGPVLVAGLTLEQIELAVREVVARTVRDAGPPRDPGPITVRLVSRQSKVFYVLGEVNAPGAYPLAGRETVLDAILIAGGATRQAALRKIVLVRPTHPEECRVVLPVCYPQIVQLGDTSTNYQIQAGDRVFVPSKHFWDELGSCLGFKDCAVTDRPQALCTTVEDWRAPASVPTAPALPNR